MIADFSFGFECDVYELKLSFKTEWMAIKWWGPLWRLLGRNPVLRLICDSNVVRFACQNISGEEILHFTYLAGITLNFLNALAENYLDLDLLDHWVISCQTWNLSPTCNAQFLNHSTFFYTSFFPDEGTKPQDFWYFFVIVQWCEQEQPQEWYTIPASS